MEFPGKIYLFLFLVAYTASVSYGYPNSPSNTGRFSPQFPSVPDPFGNPKLSPAPNTFGRPRSSSSAYTFGRPQSAWNADNLRSPLFPSVVQDFVENAFQKILPFFNDFDSASVRNLSADQLFSIFYDISYKYNVKSGMPNPKFHSLSKAQSIKENYEKMDGKFLVLVSAYTTGELLLQNEILKHGNQKRLADLFAKDFFESVKSAPNDPESYIRSSYDGYGKFLKDQGLATKTKTFTFLAVYVEVNNALSKNYQIPFHPSAFNHVPFPNPSNIQRVRNPFIF